MYQLDLVEFNIFFSATETRKQNVSLRDDLIYSNQLCFIQAPQNPVGCQT